ncbi:Oidioi.mRNA.OKI2018_I69.chr1.g2810.t1.cds [Oikopleura dioica]|uniref:Oidioi.mRNA.OKI2018_I69.chr1.g2810.t1.cds n=1 Tax=Oikopleura dioica TaxID=34765 RepID=A0ABN7SYN4_OIKDI|nr:Oidioi.mRNA.OKI2018_I69.chr1.g2810.t1.cds [Oikopleura dioica]
MLARVLFPEILGCVAGTDCFEKCGEVASCANHAFPLVVLHILPSGVRGLMFSVVIAALMSGLDSIFNSASTLFTIDIWLKFRPSSSERQLILTGRIVVVAVALLSILWIPMVESQGSGRLFYYVNEVSNHFSPVIAAVFVLAVLWDGLKERGAFWGSMIGFSVGLLRLILLFAYPADPCVDSDKPWLIENVHYMTYTAVIFVVTLVSTLHRGDLNMMRMKKVPVPWGNLAVYHWGRPLGRGQESNHIRPGYEHLFYPEMSSGANFKFLAEKLVDLEDVSVVSWDYPGQGRSDSPAIHFPATGVVPFALRLLLKELNWTEEINMVGHSMGAYLSTNYSLLYSEEIASLTNIANGLLSIL